MLLAAVSESFLKQFKYTWGLKIQSSCFVQTCSLNFSWSYKDCGFKMVDDCGLYGQQEQLLWPWWLFSPSPYLYGMIFFKTFFKKVFVQRVKIFLFLLFSPLSPLFRMTVRWAARTWTAQSPHGSQLSSPQCLSPVHLTETESATQQPPLKKRTVRRR